MPPSKETRDETIVWKGTGNKHEMFVRTITNLTTNLSTSEIIVKFDPRTKVKAKLVQIDQGGNILEQIVLTFPGDFLEDMRDVALEGIEIRDGVHG